MWQETLFFFSTAHKQSRSESKDRENLKQMKIMPLWKLAVTAVSQFAGQHQTGDYFFILKLYNQPTKHCSENGTNTKF